MMRAFFLIIFLTSSLLAVNRNEIGITVNIAKNADPLQVCERLGLRKEGSVEMMQRLRVIPAIVLKERLPEIIQDKEVNGIDFSQRCSLVSPRADTNEVAKKHHPVWGKFRILFEKYPFTSNGEMPPKNPPGYHQSVLRNKGKGVDIFVVDSGILDTHDFFVDNYTKASRAHLTWTAYEGDPSDRFGHGTHIAGIAAGMNPFGIAQNSNLHSIKVLDNTGFGSEQEILKGIDAILLHRLNNPSQQSYIVNMSIASENSKSIDTSIEKLIQSGAVVVAAAGNYATDAQKYSPANLPSVITTGACVKYPDKNSKNVIRDSRYKLSNFGPCVDLYAPGFCIYSSDCASNDDKSYKDGTSMAAAYVSGVAACIAAHYPQAQPWQIKSLILKYAIVPKQVEVNSREHRQLGSMLFACFKSTSSLPQEPHSSFSAQSAQDYYQGYFNNAGGPLRHSMSMKNGSLPDLLSEGNTQDPSHSYSGSAEGSLNSSMSMSHKSTGDFLSEDIQAMHLSAVHPSVSAPSPNELQDKTKRRQGTLTPKNGIIIGNHIPGENELLRIYLNERNQDKNIPFYAAYLEYATTENPEHWIRREPRLFSQNGGEAYVEVQPNTLYRISVDLYAGTFDYELEFEPAPIPCLEQETPPTNLQKEDEAINLFFLEQ